MHWYWCWCMLLFVLPLASSFSISYTGKGVMPFGGRAHITTAVNGPKVYLIGGLTTTSTNYFGSEEVYSFDTETDTWEILANYTIPLYGHCSATDGERIWVFGGKDDRAVNNYYGIYTIANNTWVFKPLPNAMYKCSATYVASSKKIILVYGNAPFYMYDTVLDQFVDRSAAYSGGDLAAGSVFYNDQVWLAGGNLDPTKFVTLLSDGSQFFDQPSITNGLYYAGMVLVNDVMLMFGGISSGGEQSPGNDRINMFNITNNNWTTLPDVLRKPLNGVAAVTVGPSIYLFGGLYYNVTDLPTLNEIYWVVPCVNPSACPLGCDESTGKCNLPPTAPVPAEPSPSNSSTPIDPTPVAQTPSGVPSNAPPVSGSTPTASIGNNTPKVEDPDPKVLGPAIAIPGAAIGVGIFLLIFFLKKKQKEEAEKSSDDQPGDQAMTVINPTTYAMMGDQDRYAAISAQGGDDGINPTSIQPGEIDKRVHIPYKSIKFTKEIGAGSYGKVFVGEWRGAQVAIKVNNAVTDLDGFLGEAKLTLGITNHPNLVQTFGVSLDGPNPCIVLEFCGGGSLDSLVFDKAHQLTNEKKREFATKIAYGLLHLHNNNIIHRDLAARNILMTTDGQVKISDFGMSRIIQEESAQGKTKTAVGPLRWMAPESLKDKTYSVKSDVWSYGILLYELVAGKEPHVDEDQLFIAVKIRDEAYTPKIPEDCDLVLRQVMEMCWKPDPNDRPTMEQIADFLRSHQS